MLQRIKRFIERWNSDQRGFSLIEFVVITIIVGIITVTMLPFIRGSVESYVNVRAGKELVQAARIGFGRMLAEMRMIENSAEIDYGYSNEIRFDLPGQSNINYEWEDGLLKREGAKLVEGVQNLQFKYHRSDGTEKSPGFWYDTDVWRIDISMTVGDGTKNILIEGQVSPRNFHL